MIRLGRILVIILATALLSSESGGVLGRIAYPVSSDVKPFPCILANPTVNCWWWRPGTPEPISVAEVCGPVCWTSPKICCGHSPYAALGCSGAGVATVVLAVSWWRIIPAAAQRNYRQCAYGRP